MQRFANVTKTCIIKGNITRAKKCLSIAENIWQHGNATEKLAVANVFVFSLTSFMEVHHCNIKQLFPLELFDEYYNQINNSGV